MKRRAAMLGIVILALGAIGCEREEQANQPVAYDPVLDGAFPSLPAMNVDPEFRATRAMLTGTTAEGPIPPPASSGSEPAKDDTSAATPGAGEGTPGAEGQPATSGTPSGTSAAPGAAAPEAPDESGGEEPSAPENP